MKKYYSPMLRIGGMTEGEPEDPKMVRAGGAKSKAEELVDVRDSISNLISTGVVDLTLPETRAHYQSLVQKLGAAPAQKLMNKLILYNQDAAKRNIPVEEKISMFYDTPGDDVEVSDIIKTVKGLGYGVRAGTSTSHDYKTGEVLGEKSAFYKPDKSTVMLRVQK